MPVYIIPVYDIGFSSFSAASQNVTLSNKKLLAFFFINFFLFCLIKIFYNFS